MLDKLMTIDQSNCQIPSYDFRCQGFKPANTASVALLTNDDVFSPENLKLSAKQVIAKKGCAGTDGFTVEDLDIMIETKKLCALSTLIKSGEYYPGKVKAVCIPKDKGGTRTLHIPTVIDRMIQHALVQEISTMVNHRFHERSYAYRPGLSLYDAVDMAKLLAVQAPFAVKIDFKCFFDNINHRRLDNLLVKFGLDSLSKKLIKRFYNCKIIEGKKLVKRAKSLGISQGGALSPLLANIYLHDLDKYLSDQGLQHIRYADDVVIFVDSEEQGYEIKNSTALFCEKVLLAPLNSQKCLVIKTQNLELLGLMLNNGRSEAPLAAVKGKLEALLASAQKEPEILFNNSYQIKPLSFLKVKISQIISCYKRADNFDEILDLANEYAQECYSILIKEYGLVDLHKAENQKEKFIDVWFLESYSEEYFEKPRYDWIEDTALMFKKK